MLTVKYTFEKCGRGDRAAGVSRTAEVVDHDHLAALIGNDARDYLVSQDVDVEVGELPDGSGVFVIHAGAHYVGRGTWEEIA